MGRPKGLKMSQAARDKISVAVRGRWVLQKEADKKKKIQEALEKLDKDKNLLIPSQVSNTIEVK
jgi:hypothetical protein